MTFPVIDLAPVDTGTSEEIAATANEIDEALRTIGFLAVVNHGVGEETSRDAWHAAHSCFDLPLAEKMRVHSKDPDYPYGYAPMADEALAGDSRPDPKESFNLGPPPRPEVEASGGYKLSERLWPQTPASFEPSLETYYEAMESLAEKLMRLFAVALDLDANFFDDKIDRHLSALRALNYPAQDQAEDGQVRAGAHTDYGTITILRPDDATPGLEVLTAAGNWLLAPQVPGGFIINIGDLMAMWTNDRWQSTLHRVVNTYDSAGTRRQSMAFFHQPNWDAAIECLPTCTGADNPPRYPPTRSGPWLRAKVEAAHKLGSTESS
jgi:isopenicillin N synthase-like dioxygenase